MNNYEVTIEVVDKVIKATTLTVQAQSKKVAELQVQLMLENGELDLSILDQEQISENIFIESKE